MGRIKTAKTKRATRQIFARYPDKVTTSFNKNKISIAEVAEIKSKKLRNVIAGYAIRLKKKEEI
jgi:small subunit ribosomal protein S17e